MSTIGVDEDVIKRYVKYQEKQEKAIEDQQIKSTFLEGGFLLYKAFNPIFHPYDLPGLNLL